VQQLTQGQIDAAQAFANALTAALRGGRGVHAETAVAGAARMAGTFLCRALALAPTGAAPGELLPSAQATADTAHLVALARAVLGEIGLPLDDARLGGDGQAQTPHHDLLATQRLLGPAFGDIRLRFDLTLPQAAEAAAVATAFVIHQGARVLDPHVAFGVAVYGFIEGAKSVPDAAAP
jgi:hypothetical protein